MVGISNNNNTNVPNSIPPVSPTPVQAATNVPDTANQNIELDAKWIRWKCLVCNYSYEGAQPLKQCPRCNNSDPDKFEDVD